MTDHAPGMVVPDWWPELLPLPGWSDLAEETLAAVGPENGEVADGDGIMVPAWDWDAFLWLVDLKCKGDRGRTCGERVGHVHDTGHGRVATVREPVAGRVDAIETEVGGVEVETPPGFKWRGLVGGADRWETRLYAIDVGTRPVPVWCADCGHRVEVPVGELRAAADKGAQRADKGKGPAVLRV